MVGDFFPRDDSDVLLIKTDERGNEIWSHTYGGESDDVGYCIFETDDGGFVIIGTTSSFGAGYNDAWVIKTDSLGNEQWNWTCGENNISVYPSSGFITKNDDLIITGSIYCKSSPGYRSPDDNIILMNFTKMGILRWKRTFDHGNHDRGEEVIITTEGGYAILGETDSFHGSSHDMWFIKTDSQGIEEWSQIYGGYSVVFGNSLVEIKDGGYVIVGRAHGSEPKLGSGAAWIIKTDNLGEKLWEVFLTSTKSQKIIELPDGSLLLGLTNLTSRSEVELINLNANGKIEWQKKYGRGSVGDVLQTTDGGFVICGTNHTWYYSDKILLFKTDPNGNIKEIQDAPTDTSTSNLFTIIISLFFLFTGIILIVFIRRKRKLK